jgi:hypothetical protein
MKVKVFSLYQTSHFCTGFIGEPVGEEGVKCQYLAHSNYIPLLTFWTIEVFRELLHVAQRSQNSELTGTVDAGRYSHLHGLC